MTEPLRAALEADDSSARLQAALSAGSSPDPAFVETLIARCAVEPDFYVRDMLTWAIARHESEATVDRVIAELGAETPQARSQALHTLSKIGDQRAWPAITESHLRDPDDEVARAAWRTAAGLVPAGQEALLAEHLATQFARGDRALQLSLSRAFAMLGEAAVPAVERAQRADDAEVRVHAVATERIMLDPAEGFDAAMYEARRAEGDDAILS